MIEGIDHFWLWIALGLLLATLELVAPGVYLIWLAVAALATGGLSFVFQYGMGIDTGLGLALEIVSFASLSLIAVYSARRYLDIRPILSSDPLLNQFGGRLVGEVATVVQPFEGGTGRVRLRDGEWMARGAGATSEFAPGERVQISGNDGTTLLVEPIALIEADGDDPAQS